MNAPTPAKADETTIAAKIEDEVMCREDPSTNGSAPVKFVVEAGILIRRKVINEITAAAWQKDLDCSHEVAGRMIRFTLIGSSDDVRSFVRMIDRQGRLLVEN